MKRVRHLALIAATLTIPASLVQAAAPAGGEAEQGFRLFMSVGCYECHGTVGQGGGAAGPRIAPDPPATDRLLAIVRRPLREMPAYGPKVLSDADVSAIHAYLASIRPPPSPDSLDVLRAK